MSTVLLIFHEVVSVAIQSKTVLFSGKARIEAVVCAPFLEMSSNGQSQSSISIPP